MQEADMWFLTDDYITVCNFANLDEDNVRMIKEKSLQAFQTKLKNNSTILSTLLDRLFSRFKGENYGD